MEADYSPKTFDNLSVPRIYNHADQRDNLSNGVTRYEIGNGKYVYYCKLAANREIGSIDIGMSFPLVIYAEQGGQSHGAFINMLTKKDSVDWKDNLTAVMKAEGKSGYTCYLYSRHTEEDFEKKMQVRDLESIPDFEAMQVQNILMVAKWLSSQSGKVSAVRIVYATGTGYSRDDTKFRIPNAVTSAGLDKFEWFH